MQALSKQRFFAGFGCVAAALAAVAAPAGAAPAAAAASVPAEHQAAVWQERKYSFAFLGFTSTYSCDGLADKLRMLLLAAGARADAKASSGACPNGFGAPDKFARAELTFYTLVPANAGAAVGATVDGTWQPVAFTSLKPRDLRTGDCELVQQFKTDILPLFSTRNVEEHTTCIPYQLSGSVIDLKFESLTAPTPTAPSNTKPPPARP